MYEMSRDVEAPRRAATSDFQHVSNVFRFVIIINAWASSAYTVMSFFFFKLFLLTANYTIVIFCKLYVHISELHIIIIIKVTRFSSVYVLYCDGNVATPAF